MDSYAVYVVAACLISLAALGFLCGYALWQYRRARQKIKLPAK